MRLENPQEYLALTLELFLIQEICRIDLLEQGITFIFLIPENVHDGRNAPFAVFPDGVRTFSAVRIHAISRTLLLSRQRL